MEQIVQTVPLPLSSVPERFTRSHYGYAFAPSVRPLAKAALQTALTKIGSFDDLSVYGRLRLRWMCNAKYCNITLLHS